MHPIDTTHVHTLFRMHIFLHRSYCWSTLKQLNLLPQLIHDAQTHYEFIKHILKFHDQMNDNLQRATL